MLYWIVWIPTERIAGGGGGGGGVCEGVGWECFGLHGEFTFFLWSLWL